MWRCAGGAPLRLPSPRRSRYRRSPQEDPGVYSGRLKVDYPTPYEPATIEQIRAVLERVHAYRAGRAGAVIDADTGEPVADLAQTARAGRRWRAPICRS